MKTMTLLLFLSLIMVSCSKKVGTTSSKIKILSGNYAALLSAQANNGLILYGKNDSGKTFLKRINGDTLDLNLPNGIWNFYSIAWGYNTPNADSGFRGTSSCAKVLGIKLAGTDVSLSMNLTNAGCDGDFHPNSDNVGGVRKLSSFSINSCKNLASVVDPATAAACTSANLNKGMATYIRVIMPEYTQLGIPADGDFGPAIQSKCFEIDPATSASGASAADMVNMAALNLPMPGINGMAMRIRAYYSDTPCDDASSPDIFTWKEGQVSPRLKKFSDHSGGAGTLAIDRYAIQSDVAEICRPPRLSNTSFASGRGAPFLPYTICNPDQLRLMKNNFLSVQASHFELLADLNFGFSDFQPIGDDIPTTPNAVNAFQGTFNGNNHRIDNILINCKSLFNAAGNSVGLFRMTSGATIKNLTLNKVAIDCSEENVSVDLVGMIAGRATNTIFQNIKTFGYVSGRENVGGITGYFTGATSGEMTDVHVQGTIEGKRFLGGLIGSGINIASTANKIVIKKSSFKGSIHSRLKSNLLADHNASGGNEPVGGVLGDYRMINSGGTLTNAGTVSIGNYIYFDPMVPGWRKLSTGNEGNIPYDAFIGGVAGKLTSANTNQARITEVKVSLDKIEGSRVTGGIIGESSFISVDNSYVTGLIKSRNQFDGLVNGSGFSKTAGLVGSASNGNFHHNYVIVEKIIDTKIADTTLHGVIGQQSIVSCIDNLFKGTTESGTCNILNNTLLGLVSLGSYTNFDLSAGGIWTFTDPLTDTPRLSWEILKENEVPYLKRLCNGLYLEGNRTGSGNTANDPRSVCSWGQLMTMIPGKYYELKKNLLHDGSALTSYLASGRIPAGVYHLKGNNFSLINFQIIDNTGGANTNNALFESLDAGSEISDLKISLAKVNSSLQSKASGMHRYAILAANNLGTINNVELNNNKITIDTMTTSGTASIYAGGFVALNYASGIINNAENNSGEVTIDRASIPVGSYLYAGGFVAKNLGTLSIIKQGGIVSRKIGNYGGGEDFAIPSSTCPTSEGFYVNNTSPTYATTGLQRCNGTGWDNVTNFKISNSEQIGGLAAYNNGLIQEVDFDGAVAVLDHSANANGAISPFIVTTGTGSQLKDISYRGWFSSNRANINNFFSSFQGTINRMIVSFNMSTGTNFTTVNSIIPNTGVSEIICIRGMSMADCHNGTMTYDYTSANGLTFYEASNPIAGFSYLTGWNVGTGFIPDMTKTWQLEKALNSTKEPQLMRTGGDFPKLGAGF
jgi:hypothetical protein